MPGRESFASRPEIAAALRGGVASGTRHSRRSAERCSTSPSRSRRAASSTAPFGSRIRPRRSTRGSRRYWLILALIAGDRARRARRSSASRSRASSPGRCAGSSTQRRRSAPASSTRARPRRGPARGALARGGVQRDRVAARALLRSQEEFVADASHELRTPLTALQLRLESLERERRRAWQRRPRRALRRSAGSRRWSRVCSRSRAPTRGRPAPVDVAGVVVERVETWHALAQERGVDLVADTDGAADGSCRAASGWRRSSTTSSRTRSRSRPQARRSASPPRSQASASRCACATRARPQRRRSRARVRPLLARAGRRRRLGPRARDRAQARRGGRRDGRARRGARRRARRCRPPAARLTVLPNLCICVPIPGARCPALRLRRHRNRTSTRNQEATT